MSVEQALTELREAQEALEAARRAEYAALRLRDEAMVAAHRAGASSREIGEITGMNQPNIARGRRRALSQRDVMPAELLGPTEALRASGLSVREFIAKVESGEFPSVEVLPGIHAFDHAAVAPKRHAV